MLVREDPRSEQPLLLHSNVDLKSGALLPTFTTKVIFPSLCGETLCLGGPWAEGFHICSTVALRMTCDDLFIVVSIFAIVGLFSAARLAARMILGSYGFTREEAELIWFSCLCSWLFLELVVLLSLAPWDESILTIDFFVLVWAIKTGWTMWLEREKYRASASSLCLGVYGLLLSVGSDS